MVRRSQTWTQLVTSIIGLMVLQLSRLVPQKAAVKLLAAAFGFFKPMPFIPAQAFKEIARGDEDAERFCGDFYLWCHKKDDLVDKDKPVSVEMSVSFDLRLFGAFADNSFFQRHRERLWPVIQTSALAYIASERMKNSPDVLERITAQILKSEYMNVFFVVALILGGFDHALAMQKFREYSFDDECPSIPEPKLGPLPLAGCSVVSFAHPNILR